MESLTALPPVHRGRLVRASRARRLGLAILCLVVVGLPQLVGGVYAWVVVVGATVSFMSLAATTYGTWWDAEVRVSDIGMLAVLGGVVWTAAQLVPLPEAFVGALSPDLVESTRDARRLMARPELGALPFSMDPGATRVQLVQGLMILATFVSSWMFAARGERRLVFCAVGASAAAMAGVALTHGAVGASALFGVYEPVHASPRLLAPLLNDNNLAGFLAMGVPVLISLGASERDSLGKRYAFYFGASLTFIASLFTLSRGGIAVSVAGSIVVLVFLWWRARGGGRATTAQLGVTALCFALVAVGFWTVSEPLFREIESGGLDKVQRVGDAFLFMLDAPLVGVGRGAFSAAYVTGGPGLVRAEFAENLFAQWGADWGWPVALAVVIALGIAWVRAVSEAKSRARVGALIGIAVIVVHGMVDFGLEIAGVAAVAAALAGAAFAPRRAESSEASRRAAPPLRVQSVAVAATVAMGAALVLWGPGLHADSSYALMDRFEVALESDVPIHDRALERAVELHPLEPAFPLFLGAQATRAGDPMALAWLTRAMRLAPRWASPHVQAAWYLAREERWSQALLELREAAERDPESTAELLCYLLGRYPLAAWAERAAPRGGPERVAVLERAARCLRTHPEEAAAVDHLLLSCGPEQIEPLVRTAMRLMERGETQAALEALEPGLSRPTPPLRVRIAQARILIRQGRPEAAQEALADLRPRDVTERRDLYSWQARAAAAAGSASEMRAAVDRLRGEARGTPQMVEAAWVLRHHLELQLDNSLQAYAALEAAYRVRHATGLLMRAARIAESQGDLGRAALYYEELCRDDSTNQEACAKGRENRRRVELEGLTRQLRNGAGQSP